MPKHVYVTCIVCSAEKLQQINHKQSTPRYCSTTCQQTKQMIDAVELGTASNRTLKRYLVYTNGHRCCRCLNTVWNELPIPLELEHIDGNSYNNELNNLELLCPNCHAQTATYKGANRGNGRHERRKRYAEGKSF